MSIIKATKYAVLSSEEAADEMLKGYVMPKGARRLIAEEVIDTDSAYFQNLDDVMFVMEARMKNGNKGGFDMSDW